MKYIKRSFLVAFKDETKDDKMKSTTTTTTTTEVWTQTLLVTLQHLPMED